MPDVRFYLSSLSLLVFTLIFSFHDVNLEDDFNSWDWAIFLLMTGYTLQEGIQIFKNTSSYFKSIWNYMDAILVTAMICSAVTRVLELKEYYICSSVIVLFLWSRYVITLITLTTLIALYKYYSL